MEAVAVSAVAFLRFMCRLRPKKTQNKNSANSLLRAIELFIWCQAENGTEGVRNVENKFSAFLFLCKVNELCKLPWISFGSVISYISDSSQGTGGVEIHTLYR